MQASCCTPNLEIDLLYSNVFVISSRRNTRSSIYIPHASPVVLTYSTRYPVLDIVLLWLSYRLGTVGHNFLPAVGHSWSHPDLQIFSTSRLTFVSSVHVVSTCARKCSGLLDPSS